MSTLQIEWNPHTSISQRTVKGHAALCSGRDDGRKQSRAQRGVMLVRKGARCALGFIFLSEAAGGRAGGERNFTFQRVPRTKFLSAIAPAQTR